MIGRMQLLTVGLLAAMATASPALVARDPSDKSGNSQLVLGCEGVTIPETGGVGGEGEGGESYFYSTSTFVDSSGNKHAADRCDKGDSTCQTCYWSGNGLKSEIAVKECWNPPAGRSGCSIDFEYNGYHYNSQNKEPYCGHTSGFKPFAFDLSAICYFDS